MGSLNIDGSKITQTRRSIRNLGNRQDFSIDRLFETSIKDEFDAGTTPDKTLTQLSITKISEAIKTVNSLTDLLVDLTR